jgi:hypothetical protein
MASARASGVALQVLDRAFVKETQALLRATGIFDAPPVGIDPAFILAVAGAAPGDMVQIGH